MYTGFRAFAPTALSGVFAEKVCELATEVLNTHNAKAHNWGDDQTMEKVSTKVRHTHTHPHIHINKHTHMYTRTHTHSRR